MPHITTRTHKQVFDVLRDTHYSKLESLTFDSSYIAADVYSDKFIYPGLVVAKDFTRNVYVPYASNAAYGAYSDQPYGVTHVLYDLSYGDQVIAPIWHGAVRENYCYVYGVAMGTISAAIKTALDKIKWA